MQQVKISLDDNHVEFLNKYQELGFKDKSSMVRSAIYHEDSYLKDLTNSAITDWPK